MNARLKKPRFLFSLFCIWAFVFSSLAPSFGVLNAPVIADKNFAELQKIFGDNFLICTNANDAGKSTIDFSEHKSQKHNRHCPLCVSVFSNLAQQISFVEILAEREVFSEFIIAKNIFLLAENITKYTYAHAPPSALFLA